MPLAQLLFAVGAVPFAAEVGVSAWLGRPLHAWKDTLAATSIHALTGVTSAVGKLLLFAVYVPVHAHLALWTWGGTVAEWIVAWLAYDFMAYWFHRWSHRTNLGWAIHVVHHQSEELNLATPMRTAPFRSFVDWPTILPLAVLGVPIEVVMVLYLVHVAGQTPLHTRWIPKLGPLEWVLNTPSHHRVHHGCQAGYQDANYGAHLIVFDRLFGTFVPETTAPAYGVTRPAPGWDPLRAVTWPFTDVWTGSRGWSAADRLRVWWKPPGWCPDGQVAPPPPPPPRADKRPARLVPAIWHTAVAAALCVAAFTLPDAAVAVRVVLAGLGVWSMRVQGLALEDRAPAPSAELARAAALALAALVVPVGGPWLFALAAVTAGGAAWSAGRPTEVSARSTAP